MVRLEDSSSSATAAAARATLARLHAQVLAHELSNLCFLAEIEARTPNPIARDELIRGLPAVRRLARLVADALTTDPKRRVVTVAEVLEEIDTLLVGPSRAQLPRLAIALTTEAVGQLSFDEQCPGFLLIVQELLQQAGGSDDNLTLAFSCVDEEIVVRAVASQPLFLTPFIASEAARCEFRLETHDGAVVLKLAGMRE